MGLERERRREGRDQFVTRGHRHASASPPRVVSRIGGSS